MSQAGRERAASQGVFGIGGASPRQPVSVVGELVPPGADEHVRRRTHQLVRTISRWMDNAFEIPGLRWRFGLDPIVGLFPVVGDFASAVVSLYILAAAAELRVPRVTILRMGLNIAIDYVLGSLPLAGIFLDFVWKANSRNMQLLERSLAAGPGERARQSRGDWLFVGGVAAVLALLFAGSLLLAGLVVAASVRWLSTAF